ncbi:MAG: hypothetical protein O3A63_15280, partial [Proteobacteria bacterium]|nr:hypothetical protein [Pseudomonadota bacterium]
MSNADLAALNASCECVPLSRSMIDESIASQSRIDGIKEMLNERPHLFAGSAVFISTNEWQQMVQQMQAIEAITRLPAYQAHIVARTSAAMVAPPARQSANAGLLMGYDFHITNNGPRLIEVNTNAGGAFLANEMLNATQKVASICGSTPTFDPATVKASLIQMFIHEWQLAGRQGKPHTIAIVDRDPERQYLYPDMQLAAELLRESGIEVICVDPGALHLLGDRLAVSGTIIDMVYNRLTDFSLEHPEHQLLKQAYENDQVVLSPAPMHHALFADKRNLAIFRNQQLLTAMGARPIDVETLQQLPHTRNVTPDLVEQMWQQRRNLFFKPSAGYGGRAAY